MSREPSPSRAPSMIGMIRARKIAIKIKKRAGFLLQDRRRRDNAGKAAIIHRDMPVTGVNSIRPPLALSGLSSPYGSRPPSNIARYNYGQLTIPSRGKTQPKPTYRMEPTQLFSPRNAKQIIREVMERFLEGWEYSAEQGKDISKQISETVKQRIKALGCTRYKYVCITYIGELKNQGMRVSSRCLWDPKTDTVAEFTYICGKMWATTTLYAVYFE